MTTLKRQRKVIPRVWLQKRNILTYQSTPTSKTCIDHMITTKERKRKTMETARNDQFVVTGEIMTMLENCERICLLKNAEPK